MRPISLLTHVSKLFFGIISARIVRAIHSHRDFKLPGYCGPFRG
eukprot:SAG11_NODE_15420_length_579_cov_0.518750_1_plen_43_part_10